MPDTGKTPTSLGMITKTQAKVPVGYSNHA